MRQRLVCCLSRQSAQRRSRCFTSSNPNAPTRLLPGDSNTSARPWQTRFGAPLVTYCNLDRMPLRLLSRPNASTTRTESRNYWNTGTNAGKPPVTCTSSNRHCFPAADEIGGHPMPATRTASARPTTKGIALTFDPRYVEWVIQAWLTRDLAAMKVDKLVALATAYIEERLTELTSMGLHEEDVSADAVNKAIALLKNLGLLQQRRVTPQPPRQPRGKKVAQPAPAVQMVVEPPYVSISATADGRTVLSEPTATGGIRVELVRRIVAKSPELATLLTALDVHGPLI